MPGLIQSVEEQDPLEKLMKHTGCLQLHYEVQECIAETKDWRKCQQQVNDFKECMDNYKKRVSGNSSSSSHQ